MKSYSKKPMNDKFDSVVVSTYGLPPPTNSDTAIRLAQIDDMKYFFVSATQQWEHNRPLKRFVLPGGESISCVFWDDLFFITGTDIVRSLTFRFHAFGRPVTNAKKFEEGIFSDLRNLKPGHDARLEEPKSELLDMLYKNNCIRTQKKQKVFFWFSVPHDRLFLDALERDLKREKMGMEPTTKAMAEPASSLSLDSTQELFDQLRKNMSQSADVQPIDEALAPMPITSLSLNAPQGNPSFLEEQTWSSTMTASQQKRPRVNSVPSSMGQKHQAQLMQQQKQNRLSHGSYFSGYRPHLNRLSSSSSSSLLTPEDVFTSHHRNSSISSSSSSSNNPNAMTHLTGHTLSTPLTKYQPSDYMDPIAHGVHQLEISSSLSNTSTTSSMTHNVLPSKSLDSNALKKTKTIFGNLSLFDGSPTYKLRRRRSSSSTSILNPLGRKCHRPPVPAASSTSRLAMAAVKAGFAPQVMNPWTQPQDYYCPVPECRHLFKRLEHLERHMQTLHNFTCTVCGKQFAQSEKLVQHHRLEHLYDPASSLGYGDHDDDSSHGSHSFVGQATYPSILGHHHQTHEKTSSPRHSFESSRSSGWSACMGSMSSNSSSPMLEEKRRWDDVSSSGSPSPIAPMTLLSPFKLIEQEQQQTEFLDLNMDAMFGMNDYAPYVDQYPPFFPDMNIVFGA